MAANRALGGQAEVGHVEGAPPSQEKVFGFIPPHVYTALSGKASTQWQARAAAIEELRSLVLDGALELARQERRSALLRSIGELCLFVGKLLQVSALERRGGAKLPSRLGRLIPPTTNPYQDPHFKISHMAIEIVGLLAGPSQLGGALGPTN